MTEGPAATPTQDHTQDHTQKREADEHDAEKHQERTVSAGAPEASASKASVGSAPSEASVDATPAEPIVEPPEPPVSEQRAVVALPGTHRQERPSLWRRIAMRSSGGGEAANERVLARLDVIEARVTAAELSLGNRIQALDDRFTEVWEVEEQLSQINDLRAALAEIGAGQERLEKRLGGINGKLTLVAVVVGAAVVAGVAAMLVS
jgi:hypothetical protein